VVALCFLRVLLLAPANQKSQVLASLPIDPLVTVNYTVGKHRKKEFPAINSQAAVTFGETTHHQSPATQQQHKEAQLCQIKIK
jgi:hypothetical protein